VEEHNSRSTCTSSPEWLHARLIHLKTSASNWKTNVVVGIEFNCIRWSVDWSVTIPQNPADGQSINKYKDDVAVSGVIPRNSIPLFLFLSLEKRRNPPRHLTRQLAKHCVDPNLPVSTHNEQPTVSIIVTFSQRHLLELTGTLGWNDRGRQHTHTHTRMDGWMELRYKRKALWMQRWPGRPPSHTHRHTNI
jgi:hypothetical protein